MSYYNVEMTEKAKKQLLKMDSRTQMFILNYLKNTIEKLENPRSQGKLLLGKYKGSWRYRVVNYRLLAIINDKKVLIHVFEIGHRREVYR